jgi:mannosyltransferase OCH1-like enzyme
MTIVKKNMNQIMKHYRNKIQNKRINNIKKLLSIPYPMKEKYYMKIPPNLFQTWHSKTLPPLMYNATKRLRETNPRFNYYLYDDNDCREFIKKNFEQNVVDAYNNLIPGAFKADLWRYCILYKLGGIYLDIKYVPVNGFKLINLTEKEHFCLDIDGNGIYNAIMVCAPGNNILRQAIYQIVENVRTKYYGNDRLEPTGPKLLSRYFSKEEKKNFNLKHNFHFSIDNRYILFHNYYILQSFPGYINEHNLYKKVDYYGNLWNDRKIYK